MTENQNPTPEPNPEPAPAGDQDDRYAAYDETHLRFIGDVLPSRKKAGDQDVVAAAKKAGRRVTIRKV